MKSPRNAIAANITVMDFCFAFPPVKYVSLLLTVLCLVLLAFDANTNAYFGRLSMARELSRRAVASALCK